MDPKTNTVRRSDYELVKKAEVLDPYTFRVTYKQPFSPGLGTLGNGNDPKTSFRKRRYQHHQIQPKSHRDGSIPVAEWVSDEKIVVEANPNYFQGKPYLDRIIYRIIPDTSLSEMELLTKGVDYLRTTPPIPEDESDTLSKVYSQPTLSYTYIGYNLKKPAFPGQRVRQAFTYAINREEIVQYVLYGLGTVISGPFPSHLWYYNPNVKPLPYDPEKSRQLLAEAGWKDTDGDGILDKDRNPFVSS